MSCLLCLFLLCVFNDKYLLYFRGSFFPSCIDAHVQLCKDQIQGTCIFFVLGSEACIQKTESPAYQLREVQTRFEGPCFETYGSFYLASPLGPLWIAQEHHSFMVVCCDVCIRTWSQVIHKFPLVYQFPMMSVFGKYHKHTNINM